MDTGLWRVQCRTSSVGAESGARVSTHTRRGARAAETFRLLALIAAGLTAAWAGTGCGSSWPGTTAHTAATKPATAPTETGPKTSPQTYPSTATGTRAGARVVAGTAGGVTATLKAGTHHPKVNRSWPIHFTVTKAGRPAKASVSYEYLFAGQVVAHRSHYTFEGRFSDTFHWPASAVGYPLTFRAVIVSGGARIDLDYPVQVVA
jgi:hypothetical protein